MSGGGTSTVPGSVKVGLHNVQVMLDGAVDTGTLSPWDTSVGNKDIEAATKVIDSLVDGLLSLLVVAEVRLVGLGWETLAGETL